MYTISTVPANRVDMYTQECYTLCTRVYPTTPCFAAVYLAKTGATGTSPAHNGYIHIIQMEEIRILCH